MARSVFEPACSGPFGGSEVRAFAFATGLARQDLQVQVVVDAHRPPAAHRVEGVRLSYRPLPDELPRLRDEPSRVRRWCRTPRATLCRLTRSVQKRWGRVPSDRPHFDPYLARANADVYCAFGVHQHAASVVHTAARLGRPSVLLLASDTDLAEAYRPESIQLNAYGQRADVCYFALRQATWIVAQTTHQQQLVQQRFGRNATVIRNPLPPTECVLPALVGGCRADVLWIGRADRFSKRADLAIELARRCPDLRFTLIMNPRDVRVHQQLISGLPNNVCIVPAVPWREIHAYYRSSALLLNTSDAEGFPNAFLQAAQYGLPIVSLNVDPEGMLSRHHAGVLTGPDMHQAAHQLQALSADSPRLTRLAAAGREYVRRFHDTEGRCTELADVLRKVVAASAVRATRGNIAA
jgi:glycosyltransferase involved in cell wall biosynthesis